MAAVRHLGIYVSSYRTTHEVFSLGYIRDESRQRQLQVFAPILLSALKLDTIVPALLVIR